MTEPLELTDAETLRAIAHPGRMQLLEELMLSGPATATELAERVGQSAAWCSWHLRQLARYGFVEEASGGKGRRRPWQVVARVRIWSRDDSDAELNLAGAAAGTIMLDREVAALRDWEQSRRDTPPEWRAAAFVNHSVSWLTPAELEELGAEVQRLFSAHIKRLDGAARPADAIPVRLTAWGIPARAGSAT